MKKKVIIIGAGMAGCFMGYLLAKKGYRVDIYESRPDVRKQPYDSGRSFNLTLYYRGIQAMKKAGIWEAVKEIAMIAEGNTAHYLNNKVVFDPFDAHGNEILYTVHRNHLNSILLTEVEKLPDVNLFFNTKCIEIDPTKKVVQFEKLVEKKIVSIEADIVIGADGVNSLVRATIQQENEGEVLRDQEDWGYKEVHISPELTKRMQLRNRATHTWPRKESLLIAFPNPDDSFTLMFNLPLTGKESFDVLDTDASITEYITKHFPDLTPLLPEIIHAFLNKPTGKFVTIKTTPWYHKDFLVLIGDAAHAVIPFYGQGVCAAFDDCLTIADLIEQEAGEWGKIFPQYQMLRKRNTDVLAELSKDNFIELRDKSRAPFYIIKDKADTLLHRLFPSLWLPPLYVLIAHGELPYADALALHQKQQRFAKKTGLDAVIHAGTIPWKIVKVFKK